MYPVTDVQSRRRRMLFREIHVLSLVSTLEMVKGWGRGD